MTRQKIHSLFDVRIPEEKLHTDFIQIRESEFCDEIRRYIDACYLRFSPYADNHFTNEFPLKDKFHSRIWEMILANVLLDCGYQISALPKGKGPDFKISGDQTIFIEATAPNSTDHLQQNYEQSKYGASIPEDEIILQFTSAIKTKWEKYQKDRAENVIGTDDCYVLAISGAKLHFCGPTIDLPWILKPLFGLKNPGLKIEIDTNYKEQTYVHQLIRLKEQSENKAPIEFDLFLSDKRAGISAIIFSAADIKNRPEFFGGKPGDDFILVHNPFATNPLPRNFLGRGQEWAVENGVLRKITTQSVR